MTGSAAAQGTSREAQMPFDQAQKPGRVSADSFRKLTLLLKKSEPLPSVLLGPAPASITASVPLEPYMEQAIVPVITLPVSEPLPQEETSVVQTHEVVAAQPIDIELPPLPADEPPAAPTELPLPVELEVLPPMAEATEPLQASPEPFLESQITSLRKSRLAKAKVTPPPPLPTIEEQPRPRIEAPPVAQTPEQEAESAELARSLLDMMAQGSAAGQPQERALAADTLLRMLPRLPLKSRVMLASRLCMMEQPHHLLVAKLITDPDISVSGPLLEECAQLSDEDLLRVLAEQDPSKRRMMARRRRISRPVTTALIETNDPSVLLTIARNAGAEITAEGFAMMERAAKSRHELLAPMCIRADLPVHFAFSLFWLAPPELRRYLLTRFLTDSETLTKILKIARGTQGDESSSKAQNDPQEIKLALAKASNGDISAAAGSLAEMSSLAPETVQRILEDRQGEPLMALLKTLSFPRSQVQEQVEALKGAVIEPTRASEELQSLFDSLSFNKARILLTYWDWACLGTGPYALVQ